MLESFSISRKAKALCLLLRLYVPSEVVRKTSFHSLKIEGSVIDVWLLNFLSTFGSAFLKGLFKSFSCSKQYPKSAAHLHVQSFGLLSSVCSGHFQNFTFNCENSNIFFGFTQYLFPKTFLVMYHYPTLNLQLSQSVCVDIATLILTIVCPQWRAQNSEFRGSEACVLLLAVKSNGSPYRDANFSDPVSRSTFSSLLNCPLVFLVSLDYVRIFSSHVAF